MGVWEIKRDLSAIFRFSTLKAKVKVSHDQHIIEKVLSTAHMSRHGASCRNRA